MFVISDGCDIVDLIIFFMRVVNDRNERERCSDVIIDYNCPKIQVQLVCHGTVEMWFLVCSLWCQHAYRLFILMVIAGYFLHHVTPWGSYQFSNPLSHKYYDVKQNIICDELPHNQVLSSSRHDHRVFNQVYWNFLEAGEIIRVSVSITWFDLNLWCLSLLLRLWDIQSPLCHTPTPALPTSGTGVT